MLWPSINRHDCQTNSCLCVHNFLICMQLVSGVNVHFVSTLPPRLQSLSSAAPASLLCTAAVCTEGCTGLQHLGCAPCSICLCNPGLHRPCQLLTVTVHLPRSCSQAMYVSTCTATLPAHVMMGLQAECKALTEGSGMCWLNLAQCT